MIIFRNWMFVVAVWSLVLVGCGEEVNSPVPAPTSPRSVVQPKPEAGLEEQVEEEIPAKYTYESQGKRDPFTPLTTVRKPITEEKVSLTPLQKYELDQFRVIGIIVKEGGPVAMITAPDGKSYVVREGTWLGPNDGIVKGITATKVLIEETLYDFLGVKHSSTYEMKLPRKEGAL